MGRRLEQRRQRYIEYSSARPRPKAPRRSSSCTTCRGAIAGAPKVVSDGDEYRAWIRRLPRRAAKRRSFRPRADALATRQGELPNQRAARRARGAALGRGQGAAPEPQRGRLPRRRPRQVAARGIHGREAEARRHRRPHRLRAQHLQLRARLGQHQVGHEISNLVGGAPFILDSSRNGNGPTADLEWCNRRTSHRQAAHRDGDPLVLAYLWLKRRASPTASATAAPGRAFYLDRALEQAK